MSEKPRVTRVPIKWDSVDENPEPKPEEGDLANEDDDDSIGNDDEDSSEERGSGFGSNSNEEDLVDQGNFGTVTDDKQMNRQSFPSTPSFPPQHTEMMEA